jgi:lipoprotein-releasing system permease protein
LDKKEQAKSLISLGMNLKSLRNIYFYTGLLIVFFGILCGLILGTIMCYIQINTGVFKAGSNTDLAFPVRILPINYFIVSATAGIFGLVVAGLFSKVNKNHFKAI